MTKIKYQMTEKIMISKIHADVRILAFKHLELIWHLVFDI